MRRRPALDVRRGTERALLVGLDLGQGEEGAEESLEELARLCATAGVEVVDRLRQRRRRPDVRTFVGAGKLEEIRRRVEDLGVDVVVFDDPLSAAQQRNLERAIGIGPGGEPRVKVLDRSQVILDIFAQRARRTEAKLQVELAQIDYLLPRLTRHWTHLSRQRGGGVGTRGPGETQLEVDRRRLRDRAAALRRRLREVARTRELHRRERAAVPFPTIALVGYTNAGKSTLMARLTGADVLVDDRLFATLDPTVRRLRLPRTGTVLLTDTVGFIHKLPHSLIEAFKSTLEEVRRADLLLHVADASTPSREAQAAVVRRVLAEIGAADRPCQLVWNKADRIGADERAALEREAARSGAVVISARTREGLPALRAALDEALAPQRRAVELRIPHARRDLLARLHRDGVVLESREGEGETLIRALVSPKLAGQIEKALAGGPEPC